jgi:hypothetical protein
VRYSSGVASPAPEILFQPYGFADKRRMRTHGRGRYRGDLNPADVDLDLFRRAFRLRSNMQSIWDAHPGDVSIPRTHLLYPMPLWRLEIFGHHRLVRFPGNRLFYLTGARRRLEFLRWLGRFKRQVWAWF